MTTASPSASDRSVATDALAQPELRRYLEGYVRRRVTPADADDVIQSVFCAALEARRVPLDREEVRKWITGIARRKLAAHYDKSGREQLGEPPDVEASPAPLEASSLMRWVERQATLSEADRVDETLEWMARESDGEKLEEIASEAHVPATSVRQRVSRMRRWMKARWIAELAAVVGALLALSLAAWWLWGRAESEMAKERLLPDPSALRPAISAPPPPRPAPSSSTPEPLPITHPPKPPPPAPTPLHTTTTHATGTPTAYHPSTGTH